MLMIVLLAVGAYITAILKPIAGIIAFGNPQIGDVSCNPPNANSLQPLQQPAFIFGKPGWNTMGCVHQYIIYATMVVAVIAFGIGLMMIQVKSATNPSDSLTQMVKYMGVSILIIILIPTWHGIYDGVAGALTVGSNWIASIPQGPAKNYDQMKQFASEDFMTPFDKMRDPTVAKNDCIKPHIAPDGTVDKYDMDWLCLASHGIFSADFFQTLMVFTIGNMIGIMTTLIVFIAISIKFLLTGVLAVAFPLILLLSRLPKIGEVFEDVLKVFYGLLASSLLLAIVAAVAPVVILNALDSLHQQGGAVADSAKYEAFIFFVAEAYTYLAVVIICARSLGSVIISASGVVMGAAMSGFGAVMGTVRSAGTSAIGATYGAGAANAFNQSFGMTPGAGGAVSQMFASRGGGSGGYYQGGSITNTSQPSDNNYESSWYGPTEYDVNGSESQQPGRLSQLGGVIGSMTAPWNKAMEHSAMSVHPSAKHFVEARRHGDNLDAESIWPLHRETPISTKKYDDDDEDVGLDVSQ